MKTLTLENISHSEERFLNYIHQLPGEINQITGLMRQDQATIIAALTDPELTQLCLESTFSNREQLFEFITLLTQLKEKIAFKRIEIMYTHNDFELFLNKLIREEPHFYTPLREFFELYEIYAIEWREYELKSTNFFRKNSFRYDTIRLEILFYEDGEMFFSFERTPIIDPRKDTRTTRLLPFSANLLESPRLQNFLDEYDAMLRDQEELIEATKSSDYKELIESNLSNQAILGLLRATFKCAL